MNASYYNDNDPFAAAWLANLVFDEHLPFGIIDGRDIRTIETDLSQFTQCHFFAGIGGWPLALRMAGWPADRNVWTGSCPCQPFSISGKRKGTADERHLWPEFFALIKKHRPPTVFGEQVASPLGREWLAGVQADLEALGYAVGAADLCAASVTSPHGRSRLYWVAARLADTQHAIGRTLNVHREDGCDRSYDRRQEAHSQLGTSGQIRGLADTTEGGWRTQLGHADARREQSDAQGSRQADGLAESECSRWPQTGARSEIDARDESESRCGEVANPWANSRIIECRDGKWRRIPVESSLFPLADGLPNRMGILRGAGNAIVPALAAQFIRAFLLSE